MIIFSPTKNMKNMKIRSAVLLLSILIQLNCSLTDKKLFIEVEEYQLVKEGNSEFVLFYCSTSLPKGTNVDIWYDTDCPGVSKLTEYRVMQIDSNFFNLKFPIWFFADEVEAPLIKMPQFMRLEFKINEEDNKKNEREIINLLKEEINNVIPYNSCYPYMDDSITFANHYKDYFFSVGYIFEIEDDHYEKVYAPNCVIDTAFYYQKDLNQKN
jgi:hypothetical protein